MSKRTDYSKEKKRTEPTGVRFDKSFLEKTRKDTGLKSNQSIVDYLVKFYEQQVYPIVLNPVMERNAAIGITEKQINDQCRPKDIRSSMASPTKNSTGLKTGTIPQTIDDIRAMCPLDLTGMARTQWITEQREKYGI